MAEEGVAVTISLDEDAGAEGTSEFVVDEQQVEKTNEESAGEATALTLTLDESEDVPVDDTPVTVEVNLGDEVEQTVVEEETAGENAFTITLNDDAEEPADVSADSQEAVEVSLEPTEFQLSLEADEPNTEESLEVSIPEPEADSEPVPVTVEEPADKLVEEETSLKDTIEEEPTFEAEVSIQAASSEPETPAPVEVSIESEETVEPSATTTEGTVAPELEETSQAESSQPQTSDEQADQVEVPAPEPTPSVEIEAEAEKPAVDESQPEPKETPETVEQTQSEKGNDVSAAEPAQTDEPVQVVVEPEPVPETEVISADISKAEEPSADVKAEVSEPVEAAQAPKAESVVEPVAEATETAATASQPVPEEPVAEEPVTEVVPTVEVKEEVSVKPVEEAAEVPKTESASVPVVTVEAEPEVSAPVVEAEAQKEATAVKTEVAIEPAKANEPAQSTPEPERKSSNEKVLDFKAAEPSKDNVTVIVTTPSESEAAADAAAFERKPISETVIVEVDESEEVFEDASAVSPVPKKKGGKSGKEEVSKSAPEKRKEDVKQEATVMEEPIKPTKVEKTESKHVENSAVIKSEAKVDTTVKSSKEDSTGKKGSTSKSSSIPASTKSADDNKKSKDGKMTTIAVDLGDLDADETPIVEVVVPSTPEPAPAAETKAAPAPAPTEPLTVVVSEPAVASHGDEFQTPTHDAAAASPGKKSISFATSVSPSAHERPVGDPTYTPPKFSPNPTAVSPKSPAPQAFVPPNLDESLRETYMEHVTYYTNRILPFTQSAKSLVSRQSTLLDRLRGMRSEMERAERELDIALDEFDVLKKATMNHGRRVRMAVELEGGEGGELGLEHEDGDYDGGLLATADATSSPYARYRRGRSYADRSSWYSPRSSSLNRRYYETDESEPPVRYRNTYKSQYYPSESRPSFYRSRLTSSYYEPEDYLCEHDAGGIAEDYDVEPTYKYTSSLGRYSSHYSGKTQFSSTADEDLLKETRRFEDTLRNLRSTYQSLGPAPEDDVMTSSRSSYSLHAM